MRYRDAYRTSQSGLWLGAGCITLRHVTFHRHWGLSRIQQPLHHRGQYLFPLCGGFQLLCQQVRQSWYLLLGVTHSCRTWSVELNRPRHVMSAPSRRPPPSDRHRRLRPHAPSPSRELYWPAGRPPPWRPVSHVTQRARWGGCVKVSVRSHTEVKVTKWPCGSQSIWVDPPWREKDDFVKFVAL